MKKSINKVSSDFYEAFEVRKLSFKDLDEVTNFVMKYYTPREPLGQIFKVDQDVLKAKDMMRVKEKLQHNASFGCYEKVSGRLVAVCFATIHDKRQEQDPRTDSEIVKEVPALNFVRRLLLQLEANLHEKLNANKIMMTGIGTVHPDYIGQGTMTAIGVRLMEVAIETGCEYVVGVAVSKYAQEANEKSGLTALREIKYSDFVDPVTGKKPDLQLSSIHTHAKLYCHPVPSNDVTSKL